MAPAKFNPAVFEELRKHATCVEGFNKTIPIYTPSSGELLGHIPAGRAEDVELAVARARAAQSEWANRPIGKRTSIFLRFHDLLLERQAEVLDIVQLETGKARRHAFEEVLDTAVVSRYYALHGAAILRPRRRRGALPFLTKTREFRCPVGVVGFIMPWNYPLNLAITDAVPALIAGNAAVLKPDPQASFTALWAVALLREAGMPRDVLSVVTGEGPVAGAALADRVDFIMFTGSVSTGRTVGRKAAERLIGCSLELGGKNPMLVLADADLAAAVDSAVRGCFASAGQVCVSIERIYVHESLFERFVKMFAEQTKSLKLGSAPHFSVDVGCLTSERQLRKVEEHVQDAVAKGATLVAGGRRRPDIGPLFFEPTILTNVRPEMEVYDQETFGPVVSVYPFTSEEDAVRLANATPYGLSASIWTRDTRRGVKIANRIGAGSVNVNEAYAATWGSVDAAIGGRKESGLRPRHGREGLLKYTETQTVAVQRLLPVGPPRKWDPARYARWMTRLLKLVRRTRWLG